MTLEEDPPFVLVYTVNTTERYGSTNRVLHKGCVPWSSRWKTFPNLPEVLFSNGAECRSLRMKTDNQWLRDARNVIPGFQVEQQKPKTKGELFFGPCKKAHRSNLFKYIRNRDMRLAEKGKWLSCGRFPVRGHIDEEIHIIGMVAVSKLGRQRPKLDFPVLYDLRVSHLMTFKRAYEEHKEYRLTGIPIKPARRKDVPYEHLGYISESIIEDRGYRKLLDVLHDAQEVLENLPPRKRSRACPGLFDRRGRRRIRIKVPHGGNAFVHDVGRSYGLSGRSHGYDICAMGSADSFYFGDTDSCLTKKMFRMIGSKPVGRTPPTLAGKEAKGFLKEMKGLRA